MTPPGLLAVPAPSRTVGGDAVEEEVGFVPMESAPLGASWSPLLLRVCGRCFVATGVAAALCAAAVTVAAATGDRVWELYGITSPSGGAARVAAAAAFGAVHLLAAVALVGAGAAMLGLARLVVCAERGDGWLRATARNTSRGSDDEPPSWPPYEQAHIEAL